MKLKSPIHLFYFFLKAMPLCMFLFSNTLLFSKNGDGKSKDSDTKTGWSKKPFERKAFIENKGQYTADLPSTKTNYSYCIDNGAKVFFYNNEVLFYFRKSLLTKEDMEKEKDDPEEERERESKSQEFEKEFVSMKWLNANPNATIEVSDEQQTDYGYVISKNVPKSYTAHCKGYDKLKIKNLYNGIDVEYFFNEKDGFKYNLYIAPGADISQIQQYYDGDKNIKLSNGNIVIKTIKGEVIDHAPIGFIGSNREQTTACSFILKKNIVSFNIQNNSTLPITIDPWVTAPTMPDAPVDNGVDKYGNTYITSPKYILEKYSPTGVLISSTDVMGGVALYYGDMLTDSRGYCFFNTVGFHARGDATGVDSAGNFLWDSHGITECWRFVLNECTHQVFSLTGYRHSATGFAKINTTDGTLAGYTQSGNCCQDPHCGTIDYNGNVFCVVSENGGGTAIYKWTPSNTVAATYPAVGTWGYGTGYVGDGLFSQGYNGMTILGSNLYIYDGATLYKVNKTTGATINQVTVPGGVNKHDGGLYVTSCGQIFVGSGTGVYMYDLNFNQLAFKSTTGAVYDLAFNTLSQTISACGPGFVSELAFVIPACIFQTLPVTQASCDGLPNGYTKLNLSGGAPDYTYSWSLNGVPLSQTTDSIGGLAFGTYKCVYTDSKCPIPNVDSITIVVPSVTTNAAFSSGGSFGSSNVCFPSAIDLMDSSYVNTGSIHSWKWRFGDGHSDTLQNPIHTYASSGTYPVTLIEKTSNGCIDSITKNVTVFPKPIASFTFTNKCNGTAVPFTSTSTVTAPGVLANWNWTFGDGNTGTGNTTSHTYSGAGNYTVRLIVSTSTSCSDTITHQITVFNNPVINFTYTDVCLRDSMHFVNTSTISAPDTIASYIWNFGDGGNPSNLQTPVHDYATSGTFNVTQIATTTKGCTGAITHPVNTFDAPQAAFTFSNTCLFAAGIFTNTSVSPTMGSISNWSWNFCDGSPLNTSVNSPTHLYTTPGNYHVTLISYSTNLGCADTAVDSITVFPMPIAKFVFSNVCLNQAINFHDSSTVSSGTVSGWSWNFGDGTAVSAAQNPIHTYANYGSYTVTLVVTTGDGCKDTVSKTAVVHPLPIAQYSTTNVCDGTTTQFNDLSHIPISDTIQTWHWNYGDGSAINTNPSSSHLYTATGSYPVQLWVASIFGCLDSITKTSVVNPNPTVNFHGVDTIGCEPLCVNFHDLSNISSGSNVAWLWTLGIGNGTSTLENPNHCYHNDSVFATMFFNITLKVTSDSSCVTTVTKTNYITVYPRPVAGFSVEPTTTSIVNPIVTTTDLSSGANFWNWNFGDGDTTLLHNPGSHTYKDTGTYVIRQIVSTLHSCIDTAYETITIEPEFLFYIPNAFTPNGDGVNDFFSGKGMFIKEYEMMIFDRWGNLIFYSDDINKPWDGRANQGSGVAQQDVYIYSVKITDINKRKHNYRGIVTLVR
jgi:gliding motility-associated-like protein